MITTNFQALDGIFLNKEFPIEDCTLLNNRDKHIYNSLAQYICLIVDKGFLAERVIKIMSPYIYIEDGFSTFAWIDKNGNWIDNFENPVHGYGYSNEFVIGWIPYEEDNDKEYLENLIKNE